MTQGLTSAIINSPTFDPTAKDPWTFKQWEEQARKSHLKWKAAAEFTQRRQGLFQVFKLAPRQVNNPGRGGYGRNNNWRNKNDRRTTSQGGYHMDVDATVTSDINATAGRGQQHSEARDTEPKIVARNKLTAVTSAVAPTILGNPLGFTQHPLCQISKILTVSLTI